MRKSKMRFLLALPAIALASFATVACASSSPSPSSSSVSTVEERNGKRVYFAGPMFNAGEKEYNLKIVAVLEKHGYDVFLPQRDGIEAALLEGKAEEELIEIIFAKDDGEIRKSDILFFNLDGRVPDEGACVELGIAFALGKRCYGIKTDTRAAEQSLTLNPMISGCLIEIFEDYDVDKAIEKLETYLSSNSL